MDPQFLMGSKAAKQSESTNQKCTAYILYTHIINLPYGLLSIQLVGSIHYQGIRAPKERSEMVITTQVACEETSSVSEA